MVAESQRHPAYRVLIQVEELGPVRIAQLIATVDTPWRFRTKRPFWKYLGLVVETRTTADHEMRAEAEEAVRPDARVEPGPQPAAEDGVQKRRHACLPGAYGEYYQRLLETGMREEMARLAVARKLATVLAVWIVERVSTWGGS
jgi:transposase